MFLELEMQCSLDEPLSNHSILAKKLAGDNVVDKPAACQLDAIRHQGCHIAVGCLFSARLQCSNKDNDLKCI